MRIRAQLRLKASKQHIFCNNCGKIGHAFHNCKHPITSYGIIAYRFNNGKIEYLMIRRKDTLGFVDIMRGKYQLYNKMYLMNIVNEMTLDEKRRLIDSNFNELWCGLWGEDISFNYKGEERVSQDKLENLKSGVSNGTYEYSLGSLINESTTSWTEPEWGYPKGRRNYKENDINCALREFEEETGYSKTHLNVIQNLTPLEEIFTGSNNKSYKHCYYLANIDAKIKPIAEFEKSEVSFIEWKTFDDANKVIRPYNLEKKDIIVRANNLLSNYTIV